MAVPTGFCWIVGPKNEYLTLKASTGSVTAEAPNHLDNQIWNIQANGSAYTIESKAYSTPVYYAFSFGGDGVPVVGSVQQTRWNIIPNSDNFSIMQLDATNAWFVADDPGAGVLLKKGAAQLYAIIPAPA
ncbi:hypothetical protein BU15DRAFT_76502 [Melanogaster broomeanus]|nr:hypothetical protein BU15DRAFT_76502 [Melanogaster broomeanus]